MKIKLILLVLAVLAFNACTNIQQKQKSIPTDKESVATLKTDSIKSIDSKEVQFLLALSANAIQLINPNNGSTKEINFGMPLAQTVQVVAKVLRSKPTIGINTECGAGPLKMATWNNGLTLLFQEKKKDEWLFVGWAANQVAKSELELTTMAGVGIGSTRKDMESAYVIKVNKTSLGYEFSTKADNMFGIFDDATSDAKITNMWSGVSCNFR